MKPHEPHTPPPRRPDAPRIPVPTQGPRTARPPNRGPARSGFSRGEGRGPRSSHGGGRPSHGGSAPNPRIPAPGAKFRDQSRPATTKAPDDGEPKLRFVPLGGLEEIGRNCSYYEYKNEIVIVDVGIQFPEEETPGIDYIIPNIAALEARKQDIRGIILTHGHYDHIAAIHYLVGRLGNPMIYTSQFTRAMVEKRHEEFTNAPKLRFETVTGGSKIRIGEYFNAEFLNIEHTIPEALGFVLKTPVGNMASFGDFRLDIGRDGTPKNMEKFEKLGQMGIHSLFLDSTNADYAGHGISERIVEENIEMLIKGAHGRVIIGSFSSLVDRILEILSIAERLGRKVALNGRSMKTNLEIAKNLGYFKDKKDVIIPLEEINKYKDEKIIVLTTGAQGEANAGLMRIVNGEHRLMQLKQSDTVIFSSSVIPGNERSVQTLTDNIARQVDEVYNNKLLDIHSSGHANGGDIKLVLELIKPKFVTPIHAYYYKRKHVMKLAEEVGISRDRVKMMDNGQVGLLGKDTFTVTDEKVPAFYVMVDGLGVGDVEEVVLRDRRALAQEGMVVIILTVEREKGRMLKSPDIISRGFIYLKEHHELLEEIRKRIRAIMTRVPQTQSMEIDYLKTLVRDQIGQFLYNKTRRRPMILPVIIEI